MNIENDFLTDFDLFGKVPELYYKGKSKKASTMGLVLTVIYIILYIGPSMILIHFKDFLQLT